MAKRIIKLINAIGDTDNSDPDVNGFPKVVRAELQCAERKHGLPGRRPLRADLHRG